MVLSIGRHVSRIGLVLLLKTTNVNLVALAYKPVEASESRVAKMIFFMLCFSVI